MKIKRLFCTVMAVVLILSFTTVAFADQNLTISYNAGYTTLVNSNFYTSETLQRNTGDRWGSFRDKNIETYYVHKTTGEMHAGSHDTGVANIHGTLLCSSLMEVPFGTPKSLPAAAVAAAQSKTSIKLRIYRHDTYGSSYGMKTKGKGYATLRVVPPLE